MLTRSYRDATSPFEQAAGERRAGATTRIPKYATLAVDETVKLTFPEPPTFNRMIELAKRMTWVGPKGERMQKPQTQYWVQQQRYKSLASAQLDAQGWRRAEVTWRKIAIERAEFRLSQKRDPVELFAGMKWPIDLLVDQGFLVDDGPGHLEIEAQPTQVIDRAMRCVHLWIRRDA